MASNSNISDDNKISNKTENTKNTDSAQEDESFISSTLSNLTSQVQKNKKKFNKILLDKYWDPLLSSDWDAAGPPGPLASTRIKRDLSSLFKEPLPGIFAIPDERNYCLVHCLVLGPFETPYEGGFFHFAVRFGPSYPIHPPRVRLMTTGAGQVRFNPNLYANGKVCLSILGTWTGPVWSPALNLGSLLLSIQSLLNEKPFYNEPGFKSERFYGESESYNQYLTHETIRISICGQLEDYYNNSQSAKAIPAELAEVMKESFLDLYDGYVETCNKYKKIDGQVMKDIFYSVKDSVFNFSNLLKRLKKLKERLSSTPATTEADKDKDSSLSSISDEDVDCSKAEVVPTPTTEAIIEEANEYTQDDYGEGACAAISEEFPVDDDIALFLGDDDDDYDEDDNTSKEETQD